MKRERDSTGEKEMKERTGERKRTRGREMIEIERT